MFNAEALASIPSATDLWATLSQAPGVRMLGFDVGGSHKSQQVGYESFVGSNLDDDLRRRGDTGQPHLKFWEFHTDIRSHIWRLPMAKRQTPW